MRMRFGPDGGSEVAEQQTTTAEAAAGGGDLVVLRREMLQLPKAVAVRAIMFVSFITSE
jgi:hypothetical protein